MGMSGTIGGRQLVRWWQERDIGSGGGDDERDN